jgi:predicted component of type VI protein secretion system
MKKFFIILLISCLYLTGCGNNNSLENQELDNNYTSSRITATDNTTNDNNTNTNGNIESNNTDINKVESINNTETEIASFSTKIYTPNDEARQNNIRITSSKLNGCIVKSR